jgi:hypothetical protein
MKKWLVIEAVFFTSIPAALWIYACPFMLLGAIQAFSPAAENIQPLWERFFNLTPYVGGGIALGVLWYFIGLLLKQRRRPALWVIWIAAIAGAIASWEIIKTTNLEMAALTCIPPWFLAIQLIYMSRNMDR